MKTIQFKVPAAVYEKLLASGNANSAARELVLAALEFDGEIPAPGGNRYERLRVGDSVQVDAEAWRLADSDWLDDTKAVSGKICEVIDVTRYDLMVECAGVRAPVNFSQVKKVRLLTESDDEPAPWTPEQSDWWDTSRDGPTLRDTETPEYTDDE